MLKVLGLDFSYCPANKLFQNVCFQLPEKGLVIINGDNGSGKTTLLRILSSYIIPSRGEMSFNNKTLNKNMSSLMTSQQDSFFFHLTGKESLELFANLNKNPNEIWTQEKFKNCLTLQKALSTKFAYCSTGMKQVLNFFRTINKKSALYLFDEPFRALDDKTKRLCQNEIMELAKNSLVLVAGHNTPMDFDYDIKIIIEDGDIRFD